MTGGPPTGQFRYQPPPKRRWRNTVSIAGVVVSALAVCTALLCLYALRSTGDESIDNPAKSSPSQLAPPPAQVLPQSTITKPAAQTAVAVMTTKAPHSP